MEPVRWIRGLLPLTAVVLVGVGAVSRPPVLGAIEPPWKPPPCPPGAGAPVAEASAAWYRLDGLVDTAGTLAGQSLVVGVVGGRTRAIELAPESFAAGPVGGRILVGEDDGEQSRLSLVDPGEGCSTVIAEEAAVVRSALIGADGTAIWEHRVARDSRSDLGVWRRPLDGSASRRVMRPAPADARYGPTFTTELRWAGDGSLAVSSCGPLLCRTRTVAPSGGAVTTTGPTGEVIGVASDGAVIAYEPCGGEPCPILAHARGADNVLVRAAGRAALAGDRLVFRGTGGGLHSLDVRTGATASLDAENDLEPVRDGSLATGAATHQMGAIVLAPGGRMDGRTARVLAAGSGRPEVPGEVSR